MPSTVSMKGRQFKRRFSLQPSFHKEESTPSRGAVSLSGDDATSAGDLAASKHRHKVVVMGPAKAGKTSLISQFLYGTFPERYKRTVEEMHHGEFDVAGVRLTLDILDTSGAYEFPAMRALSISSADAFILVYSLAEADSSFEEVRELRDLILSTKGCAASAVPIVVVGNKLDLVQGSSVVDRETVESIVTLDWEHGYVQASAKDNINVARSFQELLNQAKVKYNLSPALRQRRRRQSLPAGSNNGGSTSSSTAATPSTSKPPTHPPSIPSEEQLEHLEQIRERHSGSKRNSCILA